VEQRREKRQRVRKKRRKKERGQGVKENFGHMTLRREQLNLTF
jgi:hypothetical protein